ncbi:DUF4974 domain-containing protein [Sphingobacterium sp. N143]|uniref:FecR family protein n=1 Tax=Sphingobacterium sp. N143 TaxID=2746727 RepID=UPI0025751BA2|nr:FecR family protein [Sphingobacterium sp. N143]MDM1294195.1 DUF4974 domain-containing protein [Sphingobacterium sp. N143]
MSKVEAYKIIICQFLAKTLDERTKQNFAAYLDDPDFMEAWQQLIEEGVINEAHDVVGSRSLFDKIRSDERIKEQFVTISEKRNPIIKILKPVGIAALFLFFGVAALLFMFKHPDAEHSVDKITMTQTDSTVLPGSEKAQIVLENGERIDLEQLKNDTVIDNGSFEIVKSAQGTISYRTKAGLPSTLQIAYNTIITPRGGEYKLQLADGTKIWLNAATTLRYPIRFDVHERKIQLQGEAYFEVAKQLYQGKRVPFIVNTGDQQLEVLGTAFNLQNYGHAIVTTLVEGKVKLNFNDKSRQQLYLQPDEQSIFQAVDKKARKITVDPYYFTAWKEGKFAFDKTPLDEVMAMISRWYDVEVLFNYHPENFAFSGTISRYDDINQLLQTIELVGDIHFELKGRRIYVNR